MGVSVAVDDADTVDVAELDGVGDNERVDDVVGDLLGVRLLDGVTEAVTTLLEVAAFVSFGVKVAKEGAWLFEAARVTRADAEIDAVVFPTLGVESREKLAELVEDEVGEGREVGESPPTTSAFENNKAQNNNGTNESRSIATYIQHECG